VIILKRDANDDFFQQTDRLYLLYIVFLFVFKRNTHDAIRFSRYTVYCILFKGILVMPGHKVVLKYQDGKILKGWLNNFSPNREVFFVNPLKEYSDKIKLEVNLHNLKAIFFVKDFIGDKEYQKVRNFDNYTATTPSERRIIVYFKDGETLYGTSYSYNPTKAGFFVYPVDSMDNNMRIFAIISAIEKVEFPDPSP